MKGEDTASGATGDRERYTFRGNVGATRHGWLRLTPAYSVQLVREILLEQHSSDLPVLDPFCGSGTTLLACAERGLDCDTLDINPFLVWFAAAKARAYSPEERAEAHAATAPLMEAALGPDPSDVWLPELHRIDRWWPPEALAALGRVWHRLGELGASRGARDLWCIAFCRAAIESAAVTFGHQSMSFRTREDPGAKGVRRYLDRAIGDVLEAARAPLLPSLRRVLRGDARDLSPVADRRYGLVLTSPPYCNRMSYIRELRPYMYWLGHLQERSDAGELDWQAIGGTWGAATSRVARWTARTTPFPDARLADLVADIRRRSDLLGRYVDRYFHDLEQHVAALRPLLASGASVHYVVGNSKFYDTVVPVEELLASLLRAHGLDQVAVRQLRKRSSKKELFEFVVSARA